MAINILTLENVKWSVVDDERPGCTSLGLVWEFSTIKVLQIVVNTKSYITCIQWIKKLEKNIYASHFCTFNHQFQKVTEMVELTPLILRWTGVGGKGLLSYLTFWQADLKKHNWLRSGKYR